MKDAPAEAGEVANFQEMGAKPKSLLVYRTNTWDVYLPMRSLP